MAWGGQGQGQGGREGLLRSPSELNKVPRPFFCPIPGICSANPAGARHAIPLASIVRPCHAWTW